MTVKPTPEELMAYADGELDAEHARRVEQAIAADPALRAMVEDHRRTRAAAREAFDRMAEAPMSPELSRLSGTLAAPRRPTAWNFGPRNAAEARRLWAPLALPAALAAALGIGVVSTALMTASTDDLIDWRNGPSAGTQLARVLDSAPSGEASGSSERQVVVVASFEAADGRYCRQFELGGGASDGVACRAEHGWSIVALAQRPGGTEGYQAAGGENPVGLAVAGLQPGPRIEDDAERELIENKWKK
jgi:hypothetical protein